MFQTAVRSVRKLFEQIPVMSFQQIVVYLMKKYDLPYQKARLLRDNVIRATDYSREDSLVFPSSSRSTLFIKGSSKLHSEYEAYRKCYWIRLNHFPQSELFYTTFSPDGLVWTDNDKKSITQLIHVSADNVLTLSRQLKSEKADSIHTVRIALIDSPECIDILKGLGITEYYRLEEDEYGNETLYLVKRVSREKRWDNG